MSNQELIFLNYLSKVFENLDDAIVLCRVHSERHLEVLLVNQGFYQMTGYPKVKPIELGESLAGQKQNQAFIEQCYKDIKQKKLITRTSEVKLPNGVKTVSYKTVPVINSLGEVTHAVFIGRDVTEAIAKDTRIAELEAQLALHNKAS